VQTQPRRHSFVLRMMGIKHVVVATNKVDLVDFSAKGLMTALETVSIADDQNFDSFRFPVQYVNRHL
jgi:sulfate adenylyltransferase subunit 1 (EFTu-like GTPase family)